MTGPRTSLIALAAAALLAVPGAATADHHEDHMAEEAGAGKTLERMATESPSALLDRHIQGEDGKLLGEIDKVVRRKADDKLYLVLDSEGYLQPVLPESALAVEDLDLRDDDIVLMSQDAETHLSRERYAEEDFDELAD